MTVRLTRSVEFVPAKIELAYRVTRALVTVTRLRGSAAQPRQYPTSLSASVDNQQRS